MSICRTTLPLRSMLQLYSADSCPFAQRARALLAHLGIRFEMHVVDLDDRDPEFLQLSPTGKVPLLVDGKHKLYESSIITGYLAESNGFDSGFSADVYTRARERLAMLQWDQVVVPAFYGAMRAPDSFDEGARTAVTAELGEMVQTIYAIEQRVGNLLSFHCATFWARMDWLRDLSPVASLIDEHIMLRKWLDAAVAQDAIQQTLPDRDALIARYRERFGPA